MTALFSDRAPNIIVFNVVIVASGLNFALAGEDHLDQPIGVAREVFGAKRHASKLTEIAPNRQQNRASQAILLGLLAASRATRVQSNPVIRTDNCVAVSDTAPS